MVVDPGTAMLIATAVALSAQGAGSAMSSRSESKASKRRAKETKRETQAGMANDAMERGAELEAHRLASRSKLSKRKAQSMQDTSDLVRESLNI